MPLLSWVFGGSSAGLWFTRAQGFTPITTDYRFTKRLTMDKRARYSETRRQDLDDEPQLISKRRSQIDSLLALRVRADDQSSLCKNNSIEDFQ